MSMQHLNEFCVLFSETMSMKAAGQMKTQEFKDKIILMANNYRMLTPQEEKYLNKWNGALVELGFFIELHCPTRKLPPAQIDMNLANEEAEISKSEDNVLFRKEFSRKDGKEALVGNYCEFSTPFSNISEAEKKAIIQKTIANIKMCELARTDPRIAQKLARRSSTPSKWTLPDNERDW